MAKQIYSFGQEYGTKLTATVDSFSDFELKSTEFFTDIQDQQVTVYMSKEEALKLAESILEHYKY